jgi:uncharacterized membrane protein
VSKQVQLLAATYPDLDHARVTFDMLQQMHRAANIDLVDSALVRKDDKGKIHIEETTELTTGKGARRGAIITGVFGLIYPPSLLGSVLVGGVVGAIAGRLRDTGIKNPRLKETADQLEPGKAAVVALAEDWSTPDVQRALEGYEGTLLIEAIDEETMKELYKAAASNN